MKQLLIFCVLIFLTGVYAQPWSYDFGTGTGTANNANSGTGNTAFFTSTPSGGGTYRVRIGTAGGSCIQANPGTTLGTATEAQLVAATSTSTNKFGVYDWTSTSTVAYVKAKIRHTSTGNGNLNFSLGINTLASDNQGYTSHYNNSLVSFTIPYLTGTIGTVVRRISGANTTITGHGFVKDADQQIEVYANNGTTSAEYYRNGTKFTLATQTWDLWVDGTRTVTGAAKAGTLASGTNLSGFGFFAESSTGNAATVFVDDFEYSNNFRAINTVGTLSAVSTTYGTASSNTSFSVDAINLTNDLVVTAPSGFEVSTNPSSGFGSSVTLTPTSGTVSTTTIYVRLAATTAVGSYSGNVVCSSTGTTSVNVAIPSSTVSIASQTITFGALADVSEIDPPFNLTATASSGLTVSYSSSNTGVATVAGNTVTIVGPGTTTITASQAGDGNYSAATPVDQSLTVNSDSRLDQTITFNALSDVNYGDVDFGLTATASSGLTVTYSSSNTAVATVSGSTVTIVGVGSTNITASQAGDGTYKPASNVIQSLTVNTKTLTVSGAIADDKTYDATTTATISGASLVGVVGGDNVTISGGGTFDQSTVGTAISVTANLSLGGADMAKYSLTQPTGLSADISEKTLSITGVSIADKAYDGGNAATITGSPSLSGVETADLANVSLGGTPAATFTSVNIGTGISVSVSGYSISGSAAGNYTLDQPTGLSAEITAKELSITGLTADDKDYDATTTVTLQGTASLSGIVSGEESNVNLDGTASGAFADAMAGTGKTVNVSGLSISGSAAGNYTLGVITLTADINQKTLTVSGANATEKFYDGTTAATIVGGSLTGVETADLGNVSVSTIGTFASANVGDNISVSLSLTGSAAANYSLTQPGLTSNILPVSCANQTVDWNFATANPSSSAIANLSISALSQGNNNGTTVLIGSTSASSGYAGASGTNNAGAASFTGTLNTSSSTYFEFTLTPDAGYQVELNDIQFGSRSTTTGPQAYTLRSSADGYVADLATGALSNTSTWALNQPTTSAVSSSVGAAITFRLFGHDGTGSPSAGTANWRIDDLQLSVKVSAALTSALSNEVCDESVFSYTPTSDAAGVTFKWTRAAVAGIANGAITTDQTSNPSETLDNTSGSNLDVIYAYKVISNNCFQTQDVTVTVNTQVSADAPSSVSSCDGYILPSLTSGNYFSATGGTGSAYSATNNITSSMTMFVYAENGACNDENSYSITIISSPNTDAPSDVSSCVNYELPVLSVGTYYDGSGKSGLSYSAGNSITSSMTMYVYAESGTSPNCINEKSFAITIIDLPEVDFLSPIKACDSYILAPLTNGSYNSSFDGTGTSYSAGDEITTTMGLAIYAETGTTPNCTNFNTVSITIFDTPTPDAPSDLSACESYMLPALNSNNYYYSGSGGTGTAYNAGDEITSSMTMYVYIESGTTPNCTNENSFNITIDSSPTADAPADVRACNSYTLPALSAGNNYYTGSGGTGSLLTAGSDITSTQTIYVYAVNGTCSDQNSFLVTIFDCIGLDGASCNTTLNSLSDAIYAETVPGASEYRFKVVHAGTSYEAGTSYANNFFRLSWLSSAPAKYGTTYEVYASAKVGGLWMPFENACNVTTPATRLTSASCGITLNNLTDALYSYEVAEATNYRYEVRKASDNSLVSVSTRAAADNLFRLSWITGIQSGTSYNIRVSAYVGSSWQAFGPTCTVTTPAFTKLSAGSCGVTLSTLSQALYSDVVAGATNYRYEIRKQSDNSLVNVSTRGSSDNLLRLSWVSGIQLNTTYSIRVAVYVSGAWSAYGTACMVTTPAAIILDNNDQDQLAKEMPNSEEYRLSIMPNPSHGHIVIHTQANTDVLVQNELGQIIQELRSAENGQIETDLPTGVYFIRSGEQLEKLIVQ